MAKLAPSWGRDMGHNVYDDPLFSHDGLATGDTAQSEDISWSGAMEPEFASSVMEPRARGRLGFNPALHVGAGAGFGVAGSAGMGISDHPNLITPFADSHVHSYDRYTGRSLDGGMLAPHDNLTMPSNGAQMDYHEQAMSNLWRAQYMQDCHADDGDLDEPISHSSLTHSRPHALTGYHSMGHNSGSGNMLSPFHIGSPHHVPPRPPSGLSNTAAALGQRLRLGTHDHPLRSASGISISSGDPAVPHSMPQTARADLLHAHDTDGPMQAVSSLHPSYAFLPDEPTSNATTPRHIPTRTASAPPQGTVSFTGGIDGKQPKRRKRNEQQQVNNKLAQQRYREKQKQKTRELEGQVQDLQSQKRAMQATLSQLEPLKHENEMLRQRVEELQNLAQNLQGSVNRNSSALATAQSETDVLDPALVDWDSAQASGCKRSMGVDSDLKGYQDVVERMKDTLAEHGLPIDDIRQGDARYEDEGLRRSLKSAAEEASIRMRSLFLSRELSNLAPGQDNLQKSRSVWNDCLDAMQLTDAQVDKLMATRAMLLDNAERRLAQRDVLRISALAVLGSPDAGTPDPAHLQLRQEQCLQSLQSDGAYIALHAEKQMQMALDALNGTVEQSLKDVTTFNHQVVMEVLTPEQAAVLFIKSYPSNLDVLAIVNLLEQRWKGRGVTAKREPTGV